MNAAKNDWLLPALKECMNRDECCSEDCIGYRHCVEGDKDIWREAIEMIVHQSEVLGLMVDALTGSGKVHLYFATHGPINPEELIERGYISHVSHRERRYIPLINEMAYGTVIYDRPLEPWEIARMRLTSAPRE